MANVITKLHDLHDFTKIDLRGAGDIHLTQGSDFQFEVTAEDFVHDLLTLEIDDDTLVIGFEKHTKSLHTREDIIYNISLPLVTAVRIAGSGSLTCERIAGKSFVLDLPGSAKVNIGSIAVADCRMNVPGSAKIMTKTVQSADMFIAVPGSATISIDTLEADSLSLNAPGNANILLAGRVISQNIQVMGICNIKAGELQSSDTRIDVYGTGNITVQANDALYVDIKGAAHIKYYGNPVVKKSIIGTGNLKRADDAPIVEV